jgi:hypothetical protein
MKKILLLFFMLTTAFSYSAFGQTGTASIGDYTVFPGNQVVVPVVVTGFVNVAAITMFFEYDPDVVSFNTSQNPAVAGMTVFGSQWPDNIYRVGIAWAPGTAATISDTLVEVVFDYLSGTSDFIFTEDWCLISTLPGYATLPVIYTNGSISQSPVGEAQVEITDMIDVNPGTLSIPLVVNFSQVVQGVGSFTFYLLYDESKLSYMQFTNPALTEISVVQLSNPTRLAIDWVNPNFQNGGSVHVGTLMNLQFNYAGGNSSLEFDIVNSVMANNNALNVDVIYTNGTITQLSADAQVEIIDQSSASPGQLSVPIDVDFSSVDQGIGSFTFYMLYDESKMIFQGISGAALSGIEVNQFSEPTRLIIEWVNPTPQAGGSSLHGTLLNMLFDYTGGTTLLEFNENNCVMANNDAIEVSAFYLDGQITQNPATIINVSLPALQRSAGSMNVSFPLTVTHFNDIVSFDFRITFDAAVMNYVTINNYYPSINASQFQINQANGVLNISWIGGPITASDVVLFDVVFNYISGSTPLAFDEASCSISDNDLQEQFVIYDDGEISPAYEATASIPNLLATTGQPVTVPVYATGFNNLGAINFDIEFNTSVLTFTAITNIHPFLTANGTSIPNVSGNKVFFDWVLDVSHAVGPNIPDNEKLFDMSFTFNGGSSSLTFVPDNCTVSHADEGITPIQVSYTNGTVYGGIVSLTVSTITANPIEINLGGSSTITVQLKDQLANNLPGSGGVVELFTTVGTLSAVTDNNNGTYTATLTGSSAGIATITGKLGGANFEDSENVSINNTFTITVFLEGLYNSATGQMNKAKDYVGGVVVDKYEGTVADKITIELHDAANYATTIYQVPNVDLNQNGTATITVPAEFHSDYFITVKHRNHIATVSQIKSFASTSITYDYSTASAQAIGNNQKWLATGKYGIYGGDINQDGIVTIDDAGPVNTGIRSVSKGYLVIDQNGDGLVTIDDAGTVNTNIRNIIRSITP